MDERRNFILRKYHALVRVFGEISKGLTLYRTVLMEEKKTLSLKIWNSKMRCWPRFLTVPPQCSAVSTLSRAEKVYLKVMKVMFHLRLFIFKHSKIISHLKNLGYFLYTTFFSEYLCIMQNTQCF